MAVTEFGSASMSITPLSSILASSSFRGGSLSVLDQGVCSLSSFLTGIIVARALSPEAFGVYSLYFAGLLVLSGFQNALITGPARVLGVRPAKVDAGDYFKTQMTLQIILSGILVSGASVGLFILHPGDAPTTGAFLLCLVLFQLQELARVINLTRMTLVSLLRLDLVTHGLRVGLLLVAMSLDVLSPSVALLIIAISCALGMIVAGRNVFPKGPATPFRKTARSNWRYGRWLLLETIAYSASTQIYMFLTALWIDNAAVGGLSAVLVMMNAVNVIVLGVMNFSGPVARRRLLEYGYHAWRQWLFQNGALLVLGVGLFGIVVSVFAEPFLTLTYGPAYSTFAALVPIVALQLVLTAFNTVFSSAFRSAEMPQVGFVAKAGSALMTLVMAYPLLKGWGVTGAAVGLVVTQLLWMMTYLLYAAWGALALRRVTAALEMRSGK